jgi:hypothetical protein
VCRGVPQCSAAVKLLLNVMMIIIIIIIMLKGWDYVSKLRPPTSLLFIPQVIWACRTMAEYGKGKPMICQRQLSRNHTSSHLVANQDELGRRKWWIWYSKYLCPHIEAIFACRKIFRDEADGFTSPTKKTGDCGFLSLLKMHSFGRVWTCGPWV